MTNRRGKFESSDRFYYLGFQYHLQMVTADMKLKKKNFCVLGREAVTNLDTILKVETSLCWCIVKVMTFLVIMYGCEIWTIKKAEHWRIDAFELRTWRRLLRVPWTARRSNLSILKEVKPEYSLEGLMLKLKLQYFGHWCKELTH